MSRDKSLMNPADVYSEPDQVLQDASLTQEQKMKILKQWEYDARELEVAEEENMEGSAPSMLREVLKAILKLETSDSLEEQAPTTKQG
ncbi:MAG TPA: hypothetical protein VKN62_06775 [Pelovirga sp.]|nr:hypothetical protein [Pelovirga sp.]